MQKNEVYDYLAKVYLDKQPSVRSKKEKSGWRKYPFILIPPIIILPVLYLLLRGHPFTIYSPKAYNVELSTGNELIKIKYNFTDSTLKKEGYTIALSDFNIEGFHTFQFRARRLKDYGSLNVRIEIENSFNESSSYYIHNIKKGWKKFSISLSDFHEITRWDNLKRISFIIEEWNTEDKDDCIYIDEVRIIKEKKEG